MKEIMTDLPLNKTFSILPSVLLVLTAKHQDREKESFSYACLRNVTGELLSSKATEARPAKYDFELNKKAFSDDIYFYLTGYKRQLLVRRAIIRQ
jgi:hypothetical protein